MNVDNINTCLVLVKDRLDKWRAVNDGASDVPTKLTPRSSDVQEDSRDIHVQSPDANIR
jgi:hypothetical protein